MWAAAVRVPCTYCTLALNSSNVDLELAVGDADLATLDRLVGTVAMIKDDACRAGHIVAVT